MTNRSTFAAASIGSVPFTDTVPASSSTVPTAVAFSPAGTSTVPAAFTMAAQSTVGTPFVQFAASVQAAPPAPFHEVSTSSKNPSSSTFIGMSNPRGEAKPSQSGLEPSDIFTRAFSSRQSTSFPPAAAGPDPSAGITTSAPGPTSSLAVPTALTANGSV